MDFLSLHKRLAGTTNSDSTSDPKAVPCGPARSDRLNSSEVLRDQIPQPSCVICTHLGAKTQPPWLYGRAHPRYTCGWTRSSHTPASRPHACIFSHAKATRHTHCVNNSTEQKGRGQKGMQRAANTDLQPLPRPHLKHPRKASKEQTLCQIKHRASIGAAPRTRGVSDGLGCSGGTRLLQHHNAAP